MVVYIIVLGKRTKMLSTNQVLIDSIENTPDEMSVHYDPVCNLDQNVEFVYPIVSPR